MTTLSAMASPTGGSGGHILIVEDDAAIHLLLSETLGENGFAVSTATSGAEMDRALRREAADLVVLDVHAAGRGRSQHLRRLRASSNLPIIMVTALSEDVDRIVGLEIGADDYVTKPFKSRELVARIRALLRRRRSVGARDRARRPVAFRRLAAISGRAAARQPEGVRVTTTSAEFDLLLAFCQHPGEVLSREQLLELTHGGIAGPIERSVDVHVSRIRQKIEPDSRRSDLHQDRPARRLHLHARGRGPVMGAPAPVHASAPSPARSRVWSSSPCCSASCSRRGSSCI